MVSLKEKIAQMIIAKGNFGYNLPLVKRGIGGIFLKRKCSPLDYSRMINRYQERANIPLFISTDLEGGQPKNMKGLWTPFSKFKDFPSFYQIKSANESYEVGLEQGILLKKMGFNLNFSPVAEFEDRTYGGRAFSGNKKEIKSKLKGYINGLQKNVMATCKHYPGKQMFKNLHHVGDMQTIEERDLDLFRTCFKEKVAAVMVGHQSVKGVIDSKERPSSVSKEVISTINFEGIIISDEVNMGGIKKYYLFNKVQMYADLINSGNNVILDFWLNPLTFDWLLNKLERKVKKRQIAKSNIEKSYEKIIKIKEKWL
jgi:beta-N-acetylhexosaminidase